MPLLTVPMTQNSTKCKKSYQISWLWSTENHQTQAGWLIDSYVLNSVWTKTLGSERSLRGVRNERRSNPLVSKRLLRSCFPRNDMKSVIWRVFVQALNRIAFNIWEGWFWLQNCRCHASMRTSIDRLFSKISRLAWPTFIESLRLSESNTEQTAVLSGIRQRGRDDVLLQIKILWQPVVHWHHQRDGCHGRESMDLQIVALWDFYWSRDCQYLHRGRWRPPHKGERRVTLDSGHVWPMS